MEEKKYTIDDKIYIHRPLVLGQWGQLIELLQGIRIPENPDVKELMAAMGDKLPLALAVALTEEGKSPRDKDIPALAAELEFAMTPEMVLNVIDDFFALNPMGSLLERIGKIVELTIGAMVQAKKGTIISQASASLSPEGESTNETGPSGT